MSINDMTVVIGTCDSYLGYLPNCLKLLDKHISPSIKKIIAGETRSIDAPQCDFILAGDTSWTRRMHTALKEVETPYTFFILDDYYISLKLDTGFFEEIISFLSSRNGKKLMISPVPPGIGYVFSETIGEFKRVSLESDWLASVQPSVWRTDHLTSLMNRDCSPWEFEVGVSKFLRDQKEEDHYALVLDEPIYFNAARDAGSGRPREGLQNFLSSQGIL